MNFHERQQPIATPSGAEANRLSFQLKDELDDYTLTIGEASSLMIRERCKFASNRKVQRMCRDGTIDCNKLQTTRNGQPVSEWLVNEASLLRHIEKNEIKWDEGEEVSSYASGIAIRAYGDANLPPSEGANASHTSDTEYNGSNTGNAVATPDKTGDAGGDIADGESAANTVDALASPEAAGGASDIAEEANREVGEKRSLASILIENAKLTAQLEGAHNLIAEVQDDREFLREELKEARSGRKDVTAIAERMLETLESIAIGGKLMPGSRSQQVREHRSEHQDGRLDHVQSDTHDRVEVTDANATIHPIETRSTDDSESRPPWRLDQDTSEPENPFRI